MKKTPILLFGGAGSGKSTSIATIFKFLEQEPDLKVRYLMTESNAMYGLEEGLARYNIHLKEGQLVYKVCKPITSPLTVSAKNIADDFNTNFMKLSGAEAKKVKVPGIARQKHSTFYQILRGVADFKGIDYTTGKEVSCGDYLSWDETYIFVIDSLTAIVDYLTDVVKGTRVSTITNDYNDIQSNLMSRIVIPMTEQANCNVVMLGHPILSEDPNVKQPAEYEDKTLRIYVQTVGKQLNTKLPSKFSNTIYTYVDNNDNFYWAGKKHGIELSPRHIPRKDKLVPDFSKYPLFGLESM